MGKLNWTDLTGLAAGCTARDFTVSMTFRHLATVVEMVAWLSLAGLDDVGVEDGGVEELEEGEVIGCLLINGNTA